MYGSRSLAALPFRSSIRKRKDMGTLALNGEESRSQIMRPPSGNCANVASSLVAVRGPFLCIAPFPRRVPHPCVFCKGGRRCCRRNSCPFYTARCVCRRRTRPFRLREGRGTRICGGFCSLKAGPRAPPPTLRFPERTGVALRSDLAHDNHQNSNFLFRLR